MNEHETAKSQAEEKMLEVLCEYAATCHVNDILAEYPVEDDSDPEFKLPIEFERKIKKNIVKYVRKEKFNKIRNATVELLPKTGIFLLILLGSFTIMVASVQALRVKALNIILNIENQYTRIQTKDKNNSYAKLVDKQVLQDWSGYVPNYVPHGFIIDKTKENGIVNVIYYKNEQGHTIEFTQYITSNTDLRIDTEGAKVQNILIHSNDALLSEEQEIVSIVWKVDYLFSLIGEADKEEMIKMAESITRK